MLQTLFVLILAYIIFVCIPVFIAYLELLTQNNYKYCVLLVPVGLLCNASANIFLYLWKNEDMRNRIMVLLHLKTTEDLLGAYFYDIESIPLFIIFQILPTTS